MKTVVLAFSMLLVSPLLFAQDEGPFPYESPNDITVRTGWLDVALDAFVEVTPPVSGLGANEIVLTDGLNRENEGENFVAWQELTEPVEILVDLDAVKTNLSSFRIFWAVDATVLGGPVADYVPETNVAISNDGVNFTDIGIAISEDFSIATGNDYTIRHSVNDLTLDHTVSAQYVRFRVEDPPANVMCSEVTVLRQIAIPETAVNIAVGKSYVTDPPGNDGSRPDDGIRLTNGALSADAGTDTTGWTTILAGETISITVDLGKAENNLVAFRAWFNAWEGAYVFIVGTVTVEVSENGTDYSYVGLVPKLYDQDTDPAFSNVPYLIVLDQPLRARYVRFSTPGSSSNSWTAFASEFEVYQQATGVDTWELF